MLMLLEDWFHIASVVVELGAEIVVMAVGVDVIDFEVVSVKVYVGCDCGSWWSSLVDGDIEVVSWVNVVDVDVWRWMGKISDKNVKTLFYRILNPIVDHPTPRKLLFPAYKRIKTKFASKNLIF